MVRRTYDPVTTSWTEATQTQGVEAVGGPRNAERYPVFQRLDLSASRRFEWRGASVTPFFQIVNAYNRQNVFIYTFVYEANPPTRRALSQFPFLPSLGVSVQF